MKRIFSIIIIFSFLIIIIFDPVQGHVPVYPENNDDIEHAYHVHDPTKSWVVYDEIEHTSQSKYYKLELTEGERLRVIIFTPDEGKFNPGIIVMLPILTENISHGIYTGNGTDQLPAGISLPYGYSAMVIPGNRESQNMAEYEPFTASASYHTVDFDMKLNSTGTYYVIVYESELCGRFGFAVGYMESFSVSEWLMVPYDIINIHLWEGQNPALVMYPIVAVLVLGFIINFYFRKHKNQTRSLKTHLGIIGIFIAFLYIGSGCILLNQMVLALTKTGFSAAVVVTIVFASIPIVLGIFILELYNSDHYNSKFELTPRFRLKLFSYGLLGLVFWAGLIIGPVIVIILSILPKNIAQPRSTIN